MDNPWQKWKSDQLDKISQKHQVKVKEPKIYRAMTETEVKKAAKLQGVSTVFSSLDGHFLRQLRGATTETQITDRMGEYIEILWYKYRRQLGHDDPRPEYYERRKYQ